jgi:WD40 repeat protein/serine/threonine protein kinase/tetratricopeptide (TPR) repeat protein
MADKPKDIEAIYNAALKKSSGAERTAYLDAACGDDNVLRGRVEALIKAHEQAGSFLEISAIDANVTIDGPQMEGPGTKIGRYELLSLIGEGGMGLVYLAEQKEPVRRKVALKIIKPGMDSKQVVARFEAERQALAMLDHPNIAHVFDAGTTRAGLPYFVMEYVKGMSITAYCDEHKLDIEQRLKLFEHVCEGIHHAHQKGIIHRDIKPSNILVSMHGDRAVPKLIDFGIAKATARSLTDKTVFTCQGQLLGTPEYMSPEQVDLAIQDIDTRSDIYSLGVVLYELLAGVLPFERESLALLGFAEVQRTIREQEPDSPSIRLTTMGEKAKTIATSRGTQAIALARRLHRELEWIPLKAMRKDRCRRYRSASEIADDIRNYLNGLPLIAGPETARYYMQKFVRKHAGSVATVALVAVAIVLGLVVSTAMYFRAEKARVRAEKAETIAQEQRDVAEQAHEQEAIARVQAEGAEKAIKEKSEELRRTLYVNSIQLAGAKYREGNIQRVRELLESCPNDLRGWEWYRLNHISDQARMTLRGHTDVVFEAAVSPDGKYIASGSSDETIKVWDSTTGAELMTLRGHKGEVGPVSFSPDGKRIVSGGADNTIKVWDVATGNEIMTLRGHGRWINVVVFSPDGKRIVSGSEDNTIKIWDAADGQKLMTLRGHSSWVCSVAFSPDSRRIVSCSKDNTVRVWDAATGNELMTLRGHKGSILSVAFSPDSKRIVSGGGGGTIKLWDAANGEEIMTLRGHSLWLESVAFSPDGKRIVSGGADNTIKVWDVATGNELMTLRGHGNWVYSVAFTPDGKRIVSGSVDGTIKVWDAVIKGEVVTLSGHQEEVCSVAFSPDGKRLVSASTDGTIQVWDTTTGSSQMTLHDDFWISDASLSPDGKRIVAGRYDGTLKVWDSATGAELMIVRGHDNWVTSIASSPDGTRIISGSADNTIKVWDSASGDELMTLRGHKECVTSVAFGPDGMRIVSGSDDKTIRIWDAATGTELRTLRGHSDKVWSVAYSPDGKQVVSGSRDRTVKLWDAENGAELMTLRGHNSWLESVAFSPDGKRIISGSWDSRIKVWDSATGAELMTLPFGVGGDGTSAIAFSPDGKTIAGGIYDNSIKLWESTMPAGGYELRWNAEATRKVVDELYEQTGFYSEVIDKLKANKTLAESVRKVALQVANARLWQDAKKLHRETVEVVRLPGGQIEAYRVALGKAEMANRLLPNDSVILADLGLAQYRVGAFQDALAAMIQFEKSRADGHLEPRPLPLAFMAMALQQLGRAEEAEAALRRLRVLLENAEFTEYHVAQPYVMEAEKLFAGENTRLYSVWESIEEGRMEEAVQLIEELRSSKDADTTERIEGAIKWLGRAYYNRAETKISGGEFTEAISDYEAALRVDPDHALALNDLAWLRTTCPVPEFRDGVKAVEEATKANELTNWKKARYVGTLAAAYAEAGDFDSAVMRQKEAIDLLTEEEEELRADFEEQLKLYQSGKAYRESP